MSHGLLHRGRWVMGASRATFCAAVCLHCPCRWGGMPVTASLARVDLCAHQRTLLSAPCHRTPDSCPSAHTQWSLEACGTQRARWPWPARPAPTPPPHPSTRTSLPEEEAALHPGAGVVQCKLPAPGGPSRPSPEWGRGQRPRGGARSLWVRAAVRCGRRV